MRIHVIQHVPFEGPAHIAAWADARGHTLVITHVYQNDPLPFPEDFDLLVVMGGPMGVGDYQQYPWLLREEQLILESVGSGKHVLGVCLGAQLIASALGASVTRNRDTEIGWFPVEVNSALTNSLLKDIATPIDAFHWHGDTFALPPGAVRIGSSEACDNQGFIINERVVGLQFHMEVTAASAQLLIDNCGNELKDGIYIQTADEIMADPQRFAKMHPVLEQILDFLAV